MTEQQEDSISALLAEFGTRLNEMEEKQRLLKDRTLLIGENLVSTKEQYEKEISEFKKQVNTLSFEIKVIKQLNKRIIEELENFSRRTEVAILERQFKMFEPMEFARIKDVQDIVRKEILNKKI